MIGTGQHLTIAFNTQLNDNEDWMKENTIVEVAKFAIMKEDCTPVIMSECYTFEGEQMEIDPVVVYFMNYTFKELK